MSADDDEDFARTFGDKPPPPDAKSSPFVDPPKSKKTKQAAEDFAYECRNSQLPDFEREVFFAKGSRFERAWRFDFCWRPYWLAVEIEGLVVRSVPPDIAKRIGQRVIAVGRHANVAGFRDDCEKYAAAVVLGWSVLRFEQSQVRSGFALDMTIRALGAKGWRR